MRVHLGGQSIEDARAKAHRFLEATEALARRAPVSKRQQRIERRRMQTKVVLTRKLRAQIEDAIRRMNEQVRASLATHGVREDQAADDAAYEDLTARIEMAIHTLSGVELANAIESIVVEALRSGITDAQAELAIEASFHVAQTQALAALRKRVLTFAADVVERQRAAIRAELADGVASGSSIPQITSGILGSIDSEAIAFVNADGSLTRRMPADTWAEMVARTEVANAQNQGILATYRIAGVDRITWIAASDACDECAGLDGTTIDIGDEFEGGVDAPPLHPRCRCTVVSQSDEDAASALVAA